MQFLCLFRIIIITSITINLKQSESPLRRALRGISYRAGGRTSITTGSTTYSFTYDALGNLTAAKSAKYDSDNGYAVDTYYASVEYFYDIKNQLEKIKTSTSEYTFDYDTFGRLSSFMEGEIAYSYTPDGKISCISYGTNSEYEYFDRVFYYDNLGRLTSEEICDNYYDETEDTWWCDYYPLYEYEYTADGKLYLVHDVVNAEYTLYNYDVTDRLTRVITYSESGYSTKLLSNNQHSIGYSYDAESRISSATTKFSYLAGTSLAGKTLTHTYNYSDNGTLSNCIISTDGLNINVTYTYDNYLRPSSKTIHEDDFTNVVTYGYYENDSVITNEIRSYKTAVNGTETAYTYIYDGRGNITTVKRGYVTVASYEYDDLGQLIEAYADECVHKYEYDKDGNILKIDYKVEATDEFIYTHNFTYTDDAVWGKRLTGFNNESITYDEYGRTSYYRGKQIYYFWDNRFNRIESFGNASFTYYEDGMRRTKTVGGVTHYYTYDGINLIKEEWGDNILVFLYDDSGSPIGMQYRTTSYDEGKWDTYYYEKNLQGDIIAVYNAAGTKLVTYKYDTWGNFTRTDVASSAPDIVKNNPITYRGYYYDHDLDLYYLTTRYYDPETCRFVTADDPGYLGANGDLISYNLYAYCSNNPVMYVDPTGHALDTVIDIISIGWSFYDLLKNPSWENVGWLALDVAFAVVPFLTCSRLINAASKLDEVAYVGKGVNRFDDIYDTVVLGNDMDRVMNSALDIGATFYGGYGPLNTLNALHDFNSATDAMKYAGKLDNARFIIDKVNAGYKFVHIGSDGRGFFKMMKSAYGMELKILYRLKIGNQLHRAWWILNTWRRIVW